MAGTQDGNGISASPNSSEEIDSHRGTPATKISAFSPEDKVESFKVASHGIVRPNVPPAFNLVHTNTNFSPNGRVGGNISSGFQDPFVSVPLSSNVTQPSTGVSKLSPDASDFTPATSLALSSSNGHLFTIPSRHVHISSPNYLVSPAASSSSQNKSIGTKCVLSGPPGLGLRPPSIQTATTQHDTFSAAIGNNVRGFSSDQGLTRAIMLCKIPPTTSISDIYGLFGENKFRSLEHILTAELPSIGTIYLKFRDLRDAEAAYCTANACRPYWDIRCISPAHFALKLPTGSSKSSSVSLYEGQILVVAKYDNIHEPLDVGAVAGHAKQFLANFGGLMSFRLIKNDEIASTYQAEYYNASVVHDALKVNGFKICGCTLTISSYEPDVTSQPGKVSGPLVVGQESGLDSALGSMNLNSHRDTHGPQTPRTPSFSPFHISTPASRPLPPRNNASGQPTPSTLDSYTLGFPSGVSYHNSTWSPSYMPYQNIGMQSPAWTSSSPGAIGQERGALTLSSHCQGAQGQRHSGQPKLSGRQYHDNPSGHHNVVDVGRIRDGIDVRTTIMLRNIPNKIDQTMLKEIVDETSFAKYDFMYLRIDFANNCNVGYAFINFEDPYSIIDFVEARAGRRWNRYNSDKVAEVSYATIQGRDCLIQKFRNSSVMLEYPGFRPKLFHAGDGPLAGKEEDFPRPDNPSKMKRSVENAEHVGLFAPRAGQNFRDEQRRRRSQYDRGTRLAEVEDSYGLNQYTNPNGVNSLHTSAPHGESSYSSLNGPPF